MSNAKKLSGGAIVTLVAAVLALVSEIIYAVNIRGAGYFQNAAVSGMTLYTILAIAALLVAVLLGQVKAKGAAASVIELVSGALRIAAPVLLAVCLINLIAGRAEGLGFIFFSNADVSKEVQTAANLSSATGSIANMIGLGVSMIVGIVAAFFRLGRKEA